jgi:SnoaL-like polyketide cyclase
MYSTTEEDIFMGIAENKKVLYRCIELFNKCTLEWVDTYYSKELIWKEQPTQSIPKGRSGGFDLFRKTANQVLKVFPNRTLLVHRCVAEEDYVVFEQEWKGTIAISNGNYKVGDNVNMKIVTFFKLRNGLIVEQTDYPLSIK